MQCNLWNLLFNQNTKPTMKQVYYWLTLSDDGVIQFCNIGSLSALLICANLVEAGLVPIPSAREMGELIYKVGKGAKDGMTAIGLVTDNSNREELCQAFVSLDLML